MELNYFRDKLFDALNDSEGLQVADLRADEANQRILVETEDGDVIEVRCGYAEKP